MALTLDNLKSLRAKIKSNSFTKSKKAFKPLDEGHQKRLIELIKAISLENQFSTDENVQKLELAYAYDGKTQQYNPKVVKLRYKIPTIPNWTTEMKNGKPVAVEKINQKTGQPMRNRETIATIDISYKPVKELVELVNEQTGEKQQKWVDKYVINEDGAKELVLIDDLKALDYWEKERKGSNGKTYNMKTKLILQILNDPQLFVASLPAIPQVKDVNKQPKHPRMFYQHLEAFNEKSFQAFKDKNQIPTVEQEVISTVVPKKTTKTTVKKAPTAQVVQPQVQEDKEIDDDLLSGWDLDNV